MAISQAQLNKAIEKHETHSAVGAKPVASRWNPFAALFGRGAKQQTTECTASLPDGASARRVAAPPVSAEKPAVRPAAAAAMPATAHASLAAPAASASLVEPRVEANTPRAEQATATANATAERTRCAKIIEAGIASGQVGVAAVLAFQTDLDAETAIASLDAAQIDRREAAKAGMRHRAHVPTTAIPPSVIAEQIIAAANKARGEL